MNKKEKGDLLKLVYKYEEQIKAQDELLEKVFKLTKEYNNSYGKLGKLLFMDRIFTRGMMIAVGLTTLLLGEVFILTFSILILFFLLLDSIRELKKRRVKNA